MKLPVPVSFEWDEGNLEKSWFKHKVHFKEAEEIFLDVNFKIYPDLNHSEIEKRFVALGSTKHGRKLIAFFTIRENKIRVISVRDQSRIERNKNEK